MEEKTDLLYEAIKQAKQRFRESILDAFDRACAYCGCPDPITLDHVIPKFRGGQTNSSNLVPACRACNQAKGSTALEIWFPTHPYYTIERMQRIRVHCQGVDHA